MNNADFMLTWLIRYDIIEFMTTVHEKALELSKKVDSMEAGSMRMAAELAVNAAFKTANINKDAYNSLYNSEKDYIMEGAFRAMIQMQELEKFMDLDSYDGMFTEDDVIIAYSLGRASYTPAMYASRWLYCHRSSFDVPLTANVMCAFSASFDIAAALMSDEADFSFNDMKIGESAYRNTDGRIGLVGVNALAKGSVMLADGWPVEYSKETTKMETSEHDLKIRNNEKELTAFQNRIRDVHDAYVKPFEETINRMKPYFSIGKDGIVSIPVSM